MTAKLGVYIDSPSLAGFQAFNAQIYPRKIDQLLMLSNLNTDPIIGAGWASWASTLGATICTTVAPYATTLNAFANGQYDTTGLSGNTGLVGLAAQVKAVNAPVMIRLAHEMNGNWPPTYGRAHETGAQFNAGWRHIVDVFRAQGVTNAQWCWSPNKWGLPFDNAIDPTVADSSGESFYPGDAYVDIVAIDAYHDVEDSTLYTPADLLLSNYTTFRTKYPTKPFAVGEFGCSKDSRLDAFCGGKAGWYSLFFSMLANQMPDVAFIQNWQQPGNAQTPTDDWTISSSGTDPLAAAAFVTGVTSAPLTAGTHALVHV